MFGIETDCVALIAIAFVATGAVADVLGHREAAGRCFLCGSAVYVVLAVIYLAGRDYKEAVIQASLAAWWFWNWWRKRKNRLRALRQIGAKSRARLEALVRNIPRPAPRLVPQGVPA